MNQNEAVFRLLSAPGTLGFYNCCELTNIFLIHRKSKKVYNYYTIFCMEERLFAKKKPGYLTEGLLPVNKEYSLGITRSYLTLEESLELYQRLYQCAEHGETVVDIGQGGFVSASCRR